MPEDSLEMLVGEPQCLAVLQALILSQPELQQQEPLLFSQVEVSLGHWELLALPLEVTPCFLNNKAKLVVSLPMPAQVLCFRPSLHFSVGRMRNTPGRKLKVATRMKTMMAIMSLYKPMMSHLPSLAMMLLRI